MTFQLLAWKKAMKMDTYQLRLREEVVDPGYAPHALEVLLCLDGDGAQGSSELLSCHCHLDTGLWPWSGSCTLGPAWYHVALPYWQDRVGRGLTFREMLCLDAGGWRSESRRLRDKRCVGQSSHVGAEGQDRSMERLQGLLPQLTERCSANLATSRFVIPRCLKLLEQEGCISGVLQKTKQVKCFSSLHSIWYRNVYISDWPLGPSLSKPTPSLVG